jgi:tRNA dimethylallyltransferase
MNMKAPLIVIAGPTASGKSALALALSRLTPATIINADASQVYSDLRIVSARPTRDEEAEVPHKLFGTFDGATACSAADWALAARKAVLETAGQGRLPILVGGTGLYLRTLLDGIAPVPEIDPGIRAAVRAMTTEECYAALMKEDVEAAARLAPADSSRIARALEVVRSTGRTLKSWQAERTGGIKDSHRISGVVLLPPREWLFDRCDSRFDAMIQGGGIDEITRLIARALDPALPVMRAIGVREIAAIIADPLDLQNQSVLAKTATRQYAKRQYTWFRNQSPANWLHINEELNSDNVNRLAILLHDMTLTS